MLKNIDLYNYIYIHIKILKYDNQNVRALCPVVLRYKRIDSDYARLQRANELITTNFVTIEKNIRKAS